MTAASLYEGIPTLLWEKLGWMRESVSSVFCDRSRADALILVGVFCSRGLWDPGVEMEVCWRDVGRLLAKCESTV